MLQSCSGACQASSSHGVCSVRWSGWVQGRRGQQGSPGGSGAGEACRWCPHLCGCSRPLGGCPPTQSCRWCDRSPIRLTRRTGSPIGLESGSLLARRGRHASGVRHSFSWGRPAPLMLLWSWRGLLDSTGCQLPHRQQLPPPVLRCLEHDASRPKRRCDERCPGPRRGLSRCSMSLPFAGKHQEAKGC